MSQYVVKKIDALTLFNDVISLRKILRQKASAHQRQHAIHFVLKKINQLTNKMLQDSLKRYNPHHRSKSCAICYKEFYKEKHDQVA